MYISNERRALVNRGPKFPVYGTIDQAEHTDWYTTPPIGHIWTNEMYVSIYLPGGHTCNWISFRDGNGNKNWGYVPLGVEGSAQKYFHEFNSNGSTLVTSEFNTVSYGGNTYRVFTVKKAVHYRNPAGVVMGTLPVGTLLATNTSQTGATYGDHMLFRIKKLPGGSWVPVHINTYGFVFLNYAGGAMPNNRSIW